MFNLATLDLQAALSADGYRPGPLDGILGARTVEAVRQWKASNQDKDEDAILAIHTDTVRINEGQLDEICGKQTFPVNKAALVNSLNDVLDTLRCATKEHAAQVLAQLAHESDRFQTMTEYKGEKGKYAPYFGRGFIQLTWKANYEACRNYWQHYDPHFPDLVRFPDQAATLHVAALSTIFYWLNTNLNYYAMRSNIEEVTALINGTHDAGRNGLANRQIFLKRARHTLGLP